MAYLVTTWLSAYPNLDHQDLQVVPGLQEQVERLQREYEAAHQEPVVEEQEEEKG